MGHEYRIAWKQAHRDDARDWLCRRGGKAVVFEGRESFEFRFDGSADHTKMPDASVILEEEGVYFCDFSGSPGSATILRGLIDEALGHSDSSDSVVIQSL